eukprot:6708333-Pyramimonas_sp.AAC.1
MCIRDSLPSRSCGRALGSGAAPASRDGWLRSGGAFVTSCALNKTCQKMTTKHGNAWPFDVVVAVAPPVKKLGEVGFIDGGGVRHGALADQTRGACCAEPRA